VPIYSYPFISPFLYSQYYSGDYPIYPQDYPNYYQDNPYDYQDYGAQEAAAADANTIYQLQDQVQRLSQEIERLNEEQRQLAEPPPPPPPPEKPAPPTVLVFRDGRQMEVQSYAIAGRTLFILDKGSKRVPISDLNLATTQKLNAQRGVRFLLPGS